MYLPKYFSLKELLSSNTAKVRGIENTPTFRVVENLSELCRLILDPTRIEYGRPIYISSGYRCPELNRAVGGRPASQHLTGCAVDIVGSLSDMRELFDIIKNNPNIDQLLFEYNSKGAFWLHASFAENGKPKRYIRDYVKGLK